VSVDYYPLDDRRMLLERRAEGINRLLLSPEDRYRLGGSISLWMTPTIEYMISVLLLEESSAVEAVCTMCLQSVRVCYAQYVPDRQATARKMAAILVNVNDVLLEKWAHEDRLL